MKTVQVPTVHINGTGRGDIERALDEARDALDAAIDALRKTAPNGRDYYVRGNAAMPLAADEHAARMKSLFNALAEIDAIRCAVEDNVPEVDVFVYE